MPRPREYEGLRNTTLTLPDYMIQKALDMRINISEICREAIARAIQDEKYIGRIEKQEESREMFKGMSEEEFKSMVKTVTIQPSYIPKLIEWLEEKYGIKATEDNLKALVKKL